MAAFIAKARAVGCWTVQERERYDEMLWQKHKAELRKEPDSEAARSSISSAPIAGAAATAADSSKTKLYDPDIHYPLLLSLELQR